MPVNAMEIAGLMLIAASFAALLASRGNRIVRIAGAIIGAGLVVVPFGQASASTLFLGIFGPLSAATLVMAAKSLYAIIAGREEQRWPSTAIAVCLIAIGAAFYPLTFGLTSFDPYEFGYRGVVVPAMMLVLVLVGWRSRAADILCWIALAALLYTFGAYDSRNLWDYLIVPFDSIYAARVLAVRFIFPRISGTSRPPARKSRA